MNGTNPVDVALEFVGRINDGDLEGLVAMMTGDHIFIDAGGDLEGGREVMKGSWADYLSAHPEYRIHVKEVLRSGNAVAIIGTTTGSHVPTEVEVGATTVWIAEIEGDLVAEWRIYA
jgi:ketosteroid isomerase-like protein